MPFRPPTAAYSICATLFRRFYSAARLSNFMKIPAKYRPQAIEEAQKALTDYLHNTRALPFPYAEHISRNSLSSLSNAVSNIQFSIPTLFNSLQRFLRYHPINEFEFFYESIGIDYDEIRGLLPTKKFFLSDDLRVLDAACALSEFGFPWNSLGKLYREQISIFDTDSRELSRRLHGFKGYGLNSEAIIGICLVFPYVLNGEPELDCEIRALFSDLGKMFTGFDLIKCVEGNVDAWVEVCRKVKVFYDLDCQKGKVGELLASGRNIFLELPEEALVTKVDFFCRLAVNKSDIGFFLLERPEILNLDLEGPVITVLGVLKHFGMSEEELNSISQNHPQFLGRNRMVNLPHLMRALDLHVRFFNTMRNGNHHLLGTCFIGNDEELDKDYQDGLDMIHSSRTPVHSLSKLNFLHSIGYGENGLTIKVLANLHGTSTELQERFGRLLQSGITFSNLLKMVRMSPKILNQDSDILEQKVKFLCEETGSSLEYLEVFPAYLCYDLDKRIKPRYRFHMWLKKNGLCAKSYSLASMVATSEKQFMARIYGIHPAALKLWLECFFNQNHYRYCQETELRNGLELWGQDNRGVHVTDRDCSLTMV